MLTKCVDFDNMCIYTYFVMTQSTFTKQDILDMHSACACLQSRRKARSLTQEYDRILAPSGLKLTQFSLVSILLAGPLTIGELAEAVEIDRTTLTRGLMPLERDGYITLEDGPQDARQRIATLTTKGVHLTRQALELWKKAQGLYAPERKAVI